MALATLSIDLIAQLASLQAGMDQAGRIAEKNAAMIESRYKQMGAAAAAVGRILAGAFSVAGIVAFVKSTVNGLDALNDIADATGASIENLSALEDIAARTGTKMETVGDAVVRLNKTLADAKPGSEQAKALEAIGLKAAELRKLDPAEALLRVSVALASYADDGNKARLVQELFGKSVREVAPLLKDLADAGQLNATVTTEQAKEAEKFNQQLSALAKNSTDAARQVSGPLVTALNNFFAAMKRWRSNEGGLLGGVSDQFKGDFVSARLQATTDELERMLPAAERARRILADQPDSIRAKATLAEYADLQRAAAGYRAELDAIRYGSGSRRPANEGGGKLAAPKLPDLSAGGPAKAKHPLSPELSIDVEIPESMLAALKRIDATDTAKVAELREELQQLIKIRAVMGGGVADEALLALQKELAQLDPVQSQAIKNQERLNEILAATPQGKMQSVLDEVKFINEQFSAGKIDNVEQWAEAIRNATAKLPEGVQPELEKISTFAEQAGRNIQDALGDSIVATMNRSSQSIGQIWTDMLKRLVAQAAAAQLGKALLGEGFGKTGQVGGWAGDFFKWVGGLAGTRADGGPVSAGRTYLVGERGPEMIVPRSAGTVIPNNRLGGGSTFNVIVQGDASENTVRLVQGALAQFEARMMTRARFA